MAKILVVDDDQDILNITRAAFEIAGHEVLGMVDSRSATNQIFSYQPDAIVLDLMMPHISGWDLLGIIRRSEPRTSRIPIVIISGLTDVDNRVKGLRQGADDYLPKPFNPRELIARIKALLRRVQLDTTSSDNKLDIQINNIQIRPKSR